MISMQSYERASFRRVAAVAVVTAGLMVTAGSASAAPVTPGTPQAAPATPATPAGKGFFEQSRGHHIMGWGEGQTACAYIDGVRLVLFADGGDSYRSALQAYQPESSLRAVTKASVRALGKEKPAASGEVVPGCPEFAPATKPAATTATKPATKPAPKPATKPGTRPGNTGY
jgi:hypothetical protein